MYNRYLSHSEEPASSAFRTDGKCECCSHNFHTGRQQGYGIFHSIFEKLQPSKLDKEDILLCLILLLLYNDSKDEEFLFALLLLLLL